MRVLLLGPFEVRDADDLPVEIPGVRVRALLARLAMAAGRVVSADTLIDAIWGEQPPAKGANALQALVSRASLPATPFGDRTRLWCTIFRAMIALSTDDPGTARQTLAAADFDHVQPMDLAGIAHLYAALAVHDDAPTTAAELIGAASALLGAEDRRGYDNLLAPADRARALLGTQAFATAFARTAHLSPTAAIGFLRLHADQAAAQRGRPVSKSQADGSGTARLT